MDQHGITSLLFSLNMVYHHYCFHSIWVSLTEKGCFSLSMNYHLHCFSINMIFNQHCFRSTLLIICIKFSQHIKTSQLLFNLWLNFNLNCFSITCIIFSLYCFSISTDFRSTLIHYKLPLGPISKLDEHKIIFFEVLLEGFKANKAKKFEKQSFFNMEK